MLACHPCGLAVDWRRSGAKVYMQTWRGGTVPAAQVVWFKVPANRPFLPFAHAMGASIWEDPKDNDGVGEQARTDCAGFLMDQPYYKGNPPAVYLGGPYCGSIETWQQGADPAVTDPLEILPDGRCHDCRTISHTPRGGQREGGRATFTASFRQTGRGGQKEGGRAIFSGSYTQRSKGGTESGGKPPQAPGTLKPGQGGAEGGGAPPQAPGAFKPGQGGSAPGGEAPQPPGTVKPAQGGGATGGKPPQGGPGFIVPKGGTEGGGKPPIKPGTFTIPKGGGASGGKASQGMSTRRRIEVGIGLTITGGTEILTAIAPTVIHGFVLFNSSASLKQLWLTKDGWPPVSLWYTQPIQVNGLTALCLCYPKHLAVGEILWGATTGSNLGPVAYLDIEEYQ